nr:ribosomal protein L23 [Aneura pinguis]WGO61291.1 ribosomal protein L23 [Aneura pinguis]WGO61377.1 ribosomal protein L23 [Aneura pinguis]
MDQFRYPVLTEKTIRLLEKNQYSFDVDLGTDKKEVKKWLENFFGVEIIGINSHRLPRKERRVGTMRGYITRHKRVIIRLRLNSSIPLFLNK